MSEHERPPLKHTVRWTDGDKTIHLSYGLWNDLQRVCPEPSVVVEGGLTDPYLRDYLIRRCFTDTKKSVIDEKDLLPEDEMPVGDPEELEKLLAWIEGHLLYFFGASSTSLKRLGETFKKTLTDQAPVDPSKSG